MINLESRPGTNYYINLGSRKDPWLIHIGKASYGIRYVIRCNPDHYKDFADYAEFIKSFWLYNEFGNPVDSNYFLSILPQKPDTASVVQMFKKAGKQNLVSTMSQYNDKGNLVAQYDCVNMDFHKVMNDVYLKRSVFDKGRLE